MSNSQEPSIEEIAKECARIIEEGDLEALRVLCTPDARIWHNAEDKEMSIDESIQLLQGMMAMSSQRTFTDVRLTPTRDGYVDQHYMRVVGNDGTETQIPICMVITLEQGRIKRMEEYFDASAVAASLGAPHAS